MDFKMIFVISLFVISLFGKWGVVWDMVKRGWLRV